MSVTTPAAPAPAVAPDAHHEETGIWSWITTVDHKRIGIMYFITSLLFLGVGGVEALLIRIQLFRPENDFMTPELYNQLFTMHGTTTVSYTHLRAHET